MCFFTWWNQFTHLSNRILLHAHTCKQHVLPCFHLIAVYSAHFVISLITLSPSNTLSSIKLCPFLSLSCSLSLLKSIHCVLSLTPCYVFLSFPPSPCFPLDLLSLFFAPTLVACLVSQSLSLSGCIFTFIQPSLAPSVCESVNYSSASCSFKMLPLNTCTDIQRRHLFCSPFQANACVCGCVKVQTVFHSFRWIEKFLMFARCYASDFVVMRLSSCVWVRLQQLLDRDCVCVWMCVFVYQRGLTEIKTWCE